VSFVAGITAALPWQRYGLSVETAQAFDTICITLR
jgi:hypothetical protein